MGKNFTFVLITDKASKVKKFRVSVNLMTISTLFVIAFIVFAGYLFQQYFTDSLDNPTIDVLMDEVSSREERKDAYESSISSISMIFDRLEETKRKLRNLTNINVEDDNQNSLKEEQALLRRYNELESKSVLELIPDPEDRDLGERAISPEFVQKLVDYRNSVPWLYGSLSGSRDLEGIIVSGFGYENAANVLIGEHLKGIIIGKSKSSPVYALASGLVSEVSNSEELGRKVVIRHNDVYTSVYGLLNKSNVQVGDVVLTGEILGYVSDAGVYDVPHYYFEVDYMKIPQNPIRYF